MSTEVGKPSLWSRRYGRQLTSEEEREIAHNLAGFFRVLARLRAERDARRANARDTDPAR